jgi:hypothetical protein
MLTASQLIFVSLLSADRAADMIRTGSVELGQPVMNRRGTWSARILLAGVAAGVLVCTDFGLAGSRKANAIDAQFDVKTQTEQSRETISFIGKFRDSGWLSIKADGKVLDLNPTRTDTLTSYGFTLSEPAQSEKTTVTDSRVTLGIWDDWVRWTSRQAISNYVKPGTDLGYRAGAGFDSGATSQRLETAIFKNDWMRLSLFGEYARVGAFFAAPDFLIKRQDAFFKPNSTTNRLGATVERGAIGVTFEQRAQQSLDQDNAPILVQNQLGLSFSFDEWLGRTGLMREGLSWVMPSSVWLNFGQGRVRASLSQGVAGDTTSDLSVGLAWNLGKIYANLGYWHSEYQSQLYPWTGSGINGSVGFHEARWGIDMYFDLGSSAQPLGLVGKPEATTQLTSGLAFRTRF